MPSLTFAWNSQELEAWRGRKVERALQNAVKKAGGDALRALKVASSKRIRERKRIKLGKVNAGFRLYFPKTAEISEMEWRLEVSARPTPVSAYPHRQTKRGVSVAINKGTRKLIGSAFVAT